MTSHLSIYVIINLKFSIVKLPKGIMAERNLVVKGKLIELGNRIRKILIGLLKAYKKERLKKSHFVSLC